MVAIRLYRVLLVDNACIHRIHTDEHTNSQHNMRGVVLRLGSVVGRMGSALRGSTGTSRQRITSGLTI